MKEVAIIGPTASGKSALAIEVALAADAYILSLDSLSIYKEIDIVSAKPSKTELSLVKHFGIDEIYPNEHFSVERYIDLYKKTKKRAKKDKKDLIIVGGTLFYLKALLTGLSPMPKFDEETIQQVDTIMQDIPKSYEILASIDSEFAQKITSNDRYRIEKGLLIYYQTKMKPSIYFKKFPPKPVIQEIPIFSIQIDKDILRTKIEQRTNKMIEEGLIEEIYSLEKRYSRTPTPMKAVGVVETLEYLDGKYDLQGLKDKIVTNTARLAKRQRTFIRTQFENVISIDPEDRTRIEEVLKD